MRISFYYKCLCITVHKVPMRDSLFVCIYYLLCPNGMICEPEVDSKEITVTTMKPINASHPVVIELMESGFSEEDSIHAAQKFGGNRELAFNALISNSDGELFHCETVQPLEELDIPAHIEKRYIYINTITYICMHIELCFFSPALWTLSFILTLVTSTQQNF